MKTCTVIIADRYSIRLNGRLLRGGVHKGVSQLAMDAWCKANPREKLVAVIRDYPAQGASDSQAGLLARVYRMAYQMTEARLARAAKTVTKPPAVKPAKQQANLSKALGFLSRIGHG